MLYKYNKLTFFFFFSISFNFLTIRLTKLHLTKPFEKEEK